MNTPSIGQRIGYDLGRELPPEFHDWVRHDLVGHGAMERYLVRFLLPIIPFFGLVFLFPGTVGVKIGMIAMMLAPLVIFTVSLSYVWRRFRLEQHGLDPGLIGKLKTREDDRARYESYYHGH